MHREKNCLTPFARFRVEKRNDEASPVLERGEEEEEKKEKKEKRKKRYEKAPKCFLGAEKVASETGPDRGDDRDRATEESKEHDNESFNSLPYCQFFRSEA